MIALSSNAQIFDGGVYAGLTSSQIDGDEFVGYNKPGFMAGAFVRTELSNTFDLRLAVQYISKGARQANDDNITEYKIHFDYVELPVTVIWKTKNRFSFEGGLAPGYLFNIKLEEMGYQIEEDGNYTDYDVAVVLAVNYSLTDHLDFGFHFSYSTISVREIRRYYHNNSIGVSLTYNF